MRGHHLPPSLHDFFFLGRRGGNLCLASEPVDKGGVGEHAVLVLGVAELGKELLDVLLGDLVALGYDKDVRVWDIWNDKSF